VVGDPVHDEPRDAGDDPADRDRARRTEDELQSQHRQAQVPALDGGEHGGLEHDQRRRVVEQALALQHRQQPSRHADGPRDGLDRHRVGRRHHRPEHDGRGEAQPRDQRRDGAGHHHDRHGHQRHRQQRDAAPPGPEQHPRRALGGGEQQRRQEQRQDQVGFELEPVGQPRHERHRQPEHHHQRGPRQPQPVPDPHQQHGSQHEPDQKQQNLHRETESQPVTAPP